MGRRLRAAIVGTGYAGSQHIDALRALADAEIAAVVASSDERAREASARLELPVRADGYQAVVSEERVDVVHVCTPNDLHFPVAEAALRAGKHVICEKPLAPDLARAQRIPERLTLDDAVDLGQMAPLAVNAVAFAGEDQVGTPTVVFWAGAVGLLTAQVARAAGAGPVYVVDRVAGRLALAERLGLVPVRAGDDEVAARLKRAHREEIAVGSSAPAARERSTKRSASSGGRGSSSPSASIRVRPRASSSARSSTTTACRSAAPRSATYIPTGTSGDSANASSSSRSRGRSCSAVCRVSRCRSRRRRVASRRCADRTRCYRSRSRTLSR